MASKPQDPPQDSWIASDGSPLRGYYWTRIDPKVQPNYWVQCKKVCECRDHVSTQWPVDHVIIEIPACAFRCPYCATFDNLEKENRPCPARVKRHISAAHIWKIPLDPMLSRFAVKTKPRLRTHGCGAHKNS